MNEEAPEMTDHENPEWSEADFAAAVPFRDAHPEFFEAWMRAQLARSRGVDGVRRPGERASKRVGSTPKKP